MEIKKIDILSVARLSACLVGGIYFVAGVVVSLAVAFFGLTAISSFDVLSLSSALLATLLVAMVMAAVSFILAAILAWLYNIFAKYFGGIKIELATAKEPLIKFNGLEQAALKKNLAPGEAIDQAQHEINKIIKEQSAGDSYKS